MQLAFAKDFWDAPKARRADPATSHGAAARAKELQAAHICLILGALRQGPAGKDRIARRAGLTGVAVARRCSELAAAKPPAIKDTGRTEPSDAGRPERVWELA